MRRRARSPPRPALVGEGVEGGVEGDSLELVLAHHLGRQCKVAERTDVHREPSQPPRGETRHKDRGRKAAAHLERRAARPVVLELRGRGQRSVPRGVRPGQYPATHRLTRRLRAQEGRLRAQEGERFEVWWRKESCGEWRGGGEGCGARGARRLACWGLCPLPSLRARAWCLCPQPRRHAGRCPPSPRAPSSARARGARPAGSAATRVRPCSAAPPPTRCPALRPPRARLTARAPSKPAHANPLHPAVAPPPAQADAARGAVWRGEKARGARNPCGTSGS